MTEDYPGVVPPLIPSLPLQSADTNERLELENGWEILIDPTGRMLREQAVGASTWRPARVGLSWNAQFEDLRDYMGAAWYRISFQLHEFRDPRHVLLKFGAVDYFCEVFVNGIVIGTHEGGYTPFSFEITSAVVSGINEMMIRVIDPPMDECQNRTLFPEMMYNEIPHGKQNWYVQNSGIWQGVRIELCPQIYIERLDVSPDVSGSFEISARLAGLGLIAQAGGIASQVEIHAEIFDTSGRRVFEHRQFLDPSSHSIKIKGEIVNPRLWSPANPCLYMLVAELRGAVQYRRRTRFGFRSFEAKNGKLYLNREPFYMIAALDQDFYPETIHSPTSQEFVREMMVKAKHLGINLLRCHLKVAHPVYLAVADEVGMLIWTELPSWSDCWFPSDHFSSMAAVRADKMFWEILIRDWNHCCIVLQTIMNESWGINLKDAAQREWLLATFDRIKELLKPLGRLVIDNSPCEGNFHVKTDIEDFHQYYSMPDHVDKWDQWLAEFARRPDWSFSPYGDCVRTGQEPLLVSEFGNWGLPKLPELLPWWFDVSFGGRLVTRPSGVLDRYHAYGLDQIFGTFNDFAEDTQRHQFLSLKHEIESIRSYDSIQGYVITGITDVHWEVNGLLDMWRNEKVFAEQLKTVQQPDFIACKLRAHTFYSDDEIEIVTFLSHFSDVDIRGARVRWWSSSGQSGYFSLPEKISAGEVRELSAIQLRLPSVDRPTRERLELEVRVRGGQRLTENCYELFVLPRKVPASIPVSVLGDGIRHLISGLKQNGFAVQQQATVGTVVIADRYDNAVATHLHNGGHALVIANSEDALPSEWPIKIVLRSGPELDGRWFSNFNWVRPDREPFASVAFHRILGFESKDVAPRHIIHGIAPDNFEDVLAGITYGWVNNNNALAAQFQVGAGRLLLSTFRFDEYASDPYSSELLHSFVQYVSGAQCQPHLQLPTVVSNEHVDAL